MNKFWNFLKSLVGIADKTAQAINSLSPIVEPIVRQIAEATKNRTDDEILALYDKYALPNVASYLSLPQADRGQALLNAATKIVQSQIKNPISTTLIQAAIQLVLAKLKE